jgi:hypothetical protein
MRRDHNDGRGRAELIRWTAHLPATDNDALDGLFGGNGFTLLDSKSLDGSHSRPITGLP